ncbi:TetR/AcrR family transcriptional regulator [Lysinibacillus sp. SGAir0095]|uniref:TetR/AcrR family transcriptional regulator n=1 Tax=Lysinibacillus sp. SGAir0095 TaxID=2070463 RepID=UPI0010CCE122|nr:TetR/AcrR family transcriptional regulator [Lysinibacillus sp. SGAir0095]QCR34249.1 TetR family transcriptional regulator [Lysinibacillus sp. SGAir0095]
MVKKQLIMEKSLELFAENGFEATSVQQITERCGISKGAFYLYFKSKDELIYSLIDQFMTGILTDLEQAVSETQSREELLYNFLNIALGEFQKQANFAKFFITEQVLSYNKDLFERMQNYMAMFNRIIYSIVERQFAQTPSKMYLDLVFTINGLVKSYSELFIIDDYKLNLNLLCRSIVEKVTIIAEKATIQIVTPEYLSYINKVPKLTKEQLIELINTIQAEILDDALVEESLQLLKEDLHEPTLSRVVLEGLLKNIKEHEHCKWCAYLYQKFLQNEN